MMMNFIAVWHRRNAARRLRQLKHSVNQSVARWLGGESGRGCRGGGGSVLLKAVLEDNAALDIDKIVKTKKVCPICGRVYSLRAIKKPHTEYSVQSPPTDFTTLINVWRLTRSL